MSGRRNDKVATLKDQLIGTWTLVSAVREEVPSGAKTELFGTSPHGFISYGADGRMLALITRGDRTGPASERASGAEAEALFRSMLSYGGRYTIAGNEVTHHVDISWNESFTGSRQTRTATLDGDRLTLATPLSPDPIDGKMSVRRMVWRKI